MVSRAIEQTLIPCHKNPVFNFYTCIVVSVFQVTDTKGHILYHKEDAKKGKFAFTTEEYDMFEVCFESKMIAGKK